MKSHPECALHATLGFLRAPRCGEGGHGMRVRGGCVPPGTTADFTCQNPEATTLYQGVTEACPHAAIHDPRRVRVPGLQMRTFVSYVEAVGRVTETLRAMRVKATAATRMKAA